MLRRTSTLAALLISILSTGAATQDTASILAAASKAMGADSLNSSPTPEPRARGLRPEQGHRHPMGPANATRITQYTRTINFGRRRTPGAGLPGDWTDPAAHRAWGAAAMPGVFNQNITGQQASTNWNQALNIWTTPWGFLKGAAANNATVRQQGGQQMVALSPADLNSPSGQTYTVTGYINNQNLVTKVETRVEHAALA